LILLLSCADDDATKPDVTPPGKVEDLAVVDTTDGVITLTWTAPGDDGDGGRAAWYDIRCSTTLASEAEWSAAAVVADSTRVPNVAGETVSLTVVGLGEGAWLFGLKTADEVPNWSAMSNVAGATLIDTTAPEQVTDLAVVLVTEVTMKLAWTAPGDDGAAGTASAYDLRYALTPITAETWDAALQVEGTPAPKLHGSEESRVVTGLEQATGYYFALKATDNAGNESPLSNIVSKSTARLVRLTTTPPFFPQFGAGEPVWSPDGQTIAFSADWEEQWQYTELYLLSVNGGESVKLTDEPDGARFPSWSPDGTRLVFSSKRTEQVSTIWMMDAVPGASATEVVSTPSPVSLAYCVWSPDGSHIAYRASTWSETPPYRILTSDIYTVALSGGYPHLVIGESGWPAGLGWSPDGSRIVFSSMRSGDSDIWVIPAAGGHAVQLTHDPARDSTPAWSPDGQRIAFASNRGGTENYDIWSMTPTGEDLIQITFGSGSKFGPSWAPDGKGIAFSVGEGDTRDIWVLRWD
jgi:Tol biopolymer transport system component